MTSKHVTTSKLLGGKSTMSAMMSRLCHPRIRSSRSSPMAKTPFASKARSPAQVPAPTSRTNSSVLVCWATYSYQPICVGSRPATRLASSPHGTGSRKAGVLCRSGSKRGTSIRSSHSPEQLAQHRTVDGALGRVAHLQQGPFAGKEFDRLLHIDRNVGLRARKLLLEQIDDVLHLPTAVAQLPNQGCRLVEVDRLVGAQTIEQVLTLHFLDKEAEGLLWHGRRRHGANPLC